MSFQKKDNVLFVVRALPYEAAGTPIVIRNLLANLPEKGYYVLGRRPHPAKRLPNNVKQKMFQIPILYTKGHRFWKYFSILPGFVMGLWIIKRHKINSVVGVFQDDASLYLAYLLAKVFPKTKFFPYLMDLYAEQEEGAHNKQLVIFERAAKIIVANDGILRLLSKKYSAFNFATIPIIASSYPTPMTTRKIKSDHNPFSIVYSGSVNPDRIETLRIFTKLIADDSRFSFKYLTAQSKEFLRNEQVFFDGFEHVLCKSNEELMQELNQADLLYLPIRFTYSPDKKAQMQTVFGAKTFEYLVSQTPILVHCPADFYNSTFFEENKAAYVLNSLQEKDVSAFLEQIFEIYNDTATEIIQHANNAAKQFTPEVVIGNLTKVLHGNS